MARTPRPIGLSSTPTATPTLNIQHSLMPESSHPVPAVQRPISTPIVLTMEGATQAGNKAQLAIADATKRVTAIAKTSDMDELGKLLNQTLEAAKGYDPEGKQGKGIFGFIRRKREELRANFDSVDKRVNDLVVQIDQRIDLFERRVTDLDQIGVDNRKYHDSLQGEIDHMNDGIAYMEANPPEVIDGDVFSAQKAQEWQAVISWARGRSSDLSRAQVVSQQQDAQINIMKQNSTALASKFGNLKKTTLPLLQQTFTLYIINMEQAKQAEFATRMDDLNDETLRKNAASIGQNTVAIHTALARSSFSVEAIEANKNSVIQALNDIEQIRAQTKERLKVEAPRLEAASRELAERLARRPTA